MPPHPGRTNSTSNSPSRSKSKSRSPSSSNRVDMTPSPPRYVSEEVEKWCENVKQNLMRPVEPASGLIDYRKIEGKTMAIYDPTEDLEQRLKDVRRKESATGVDALTRDEVWRQRFHQAFSKAQPLA